MNLVQLFIPELVLLSGVVILLLVSAVKRVRRFIKPLCLCTVLAACVALIVLQDMQEVVVWGKWFQRDPVVFVFQLLAGLCVAGFLLVWNYAAFEAGILIIGLLFGGMVALLATDFIVLYIALEIQAVVLYVLIAKNRTVKSGEAALKYFAQSALAGGFFLYGTSLLYAGIGSTSFYFQLPTHVGQFDWIMASVGTVFILVTVLFKTSIVPFHLWTPDVYEGSDVLVTGLFDMVSKLLGIGVLINVISAIAPVVPHIDTLMITACVMSMIVGALACFKATSLRRLLGYLAISNTGMALLPFLLYQYHAETSIIIVLMYLMAYLPAAFCLFVLMNCMYKVSDDQKISDIKDLSLLVNSHPMVAVLMSVCVVSIAGIIPAGFLAKFNIMVSMVDNYIVLVIALLASVVVAFHYIRLVYFMFFAQGTHCMVMARFSSSDKIALTIGMVLFLTMVLGFGEIMGILERVLDVLWDQPI